MRGNRGAISVFIILLIVPIYLFQAVLIEYARAKLADQQLEAAVKAAMRSIGAAYDDRLQLYGLYGAANNGQMETQFEQILQHNLGHGFANTAYVSSSYTMGASLADPQIFVDQVMEEMKYRAPLEFASHMTDKLLKSGMSDGLREFSTFADQSKKIDRTVRKRDEAMKRVWQAFSNWDDQLIQLQDLRQQVLDLEPNHSEMRRLDVTVLRQDRERLQEEKSELLQVEEISEAEQSRISEIDRQIDQINERLSNYYAWLDELQALHTRVQRLVRQVSDIRDKLLDHLAEAETQNAELRQMLEEWNIELGSELLQSIEIMEDADFTLIRDRCSLEISRLSSLGELFSTLEHSQTSTLASEIDHFLQVWRNWMSQVRNAQSEQALREEREQAEKKAAEDEFADQIEQVMQMMTGCDQERLEEEKQLYASLKERTSRAKEREAEEEEQSYAEGRDAEDDAVGMAQMIGQIGERLTESVYVNEYALLTFNYRTFDAVKGTGSSQHRMALSEPQSHPLSNQEVEYILYGFHTCAANYSAAYWEIFSVRLAIRTLESLMSPKNGWKMLGSPLIAFLWALAEGAVKAYQDTQKLIHGEEVALSAKIAPTLTWSYTDYLRLFLLLHGGKDSYVRRMQALVEVNTGKDLTMLHTSWDMQAEGSLRAVFLGGYRYHPKVEAAWGYY